jgi:type IV pilus assembly protein PilC
MAKFEYIAMDATGKEKKGVIEAESQSDATAKLKQQNMIPTSVTQQGGKSKSVKKKKGGGLGSMTIGTPKMTRKALTTFTRQLATLLEAGLPLVRSIRTLAKQAKKDVMLKEILTRIGDSIEGGSAFSEALEQHPKSFDRLYVNMIKAGEASGAMEGVLNRLADFMEKAEALRRKVKGALMYPMSVLFIALTITWGLMTFIVPKFKLIFDDLLEGEPLPGLTEFVISLSNFIQNYWYMIFGGAIFGFVAFKMFKKTDKGALIIDTILLKMPPLGGMVTKVNTAQFCRVLSTLLGSGVAILNSLEIVRNTTSNRVVVKAVQNVHDSVKEGESVGRPLEQSNVFPLMMISMVEVGEETGALPEMLVRVADIYEEEVDVAVDGLTSLIEPIMIVFLAVIVGGIVIAMFLPMIALMNKM